MSGSYRLQTPKARPPPPLRFDNSPFKSSPSVNVHQNDEPLLYDLPPTTSMSPPTSPTSKARLLSPTSPTFSTRSRAARNGRPTPPPSARNRSVTPLGVAPSELEKFAECCRAWYYNQDEESGRIMTQTLATLLPSQRATFSRLQASIRSDYHHSVNVRRTAEFQAHLTATQPGGSLSLLARGDPHGNVATKERNERLERFIRSWCNMGMPGTLPFFEALWAVMRLQVVPENLGGAAGNRIEWEFDDAVFKEAAGKEFMLEAIDVLKGVLAFEESPSPQCLTPSRLEPYPGTASIHSRSQSQPLTAGQNLITSAQPKRARAPSDPFLDTPPLSRSAASVSSISPGNTSFTEEPPSPTLAQGERNVPSRGSYAFEDSEEIYMRIWTSPDLPDAEFLELLKLFPTFVSRRPLPRFIPLSTARQADIEEGDDDSGEGRRVHFGTGSMWISSKRRSDGWEGSWWSRFILWWKRLFC